MKVLFINPSTEHRISTNLPTMVEEERGVLPTLGLLYVASYLQKHSDHEVEFLDMQIDEMTYPALEAEIRRRRPGVVAIQAITFTLIDAMLVAKTVKKVSADITVVMGGPHVYIYPEDTIRRSEVDFLIPGEGEVAFAKLMEVLPSRDETRLRQVKGLVFKNGNQIINTGWEDLLPSLDNLPFPARSLSPYKKYFSIIAKRNPVTTMITSRGCPYRCSFCMRPHLGKQFRAHSARYVVEEMKECLSMGIREIMIYDDTFTIERERVVEICNEIIREGLEVGWDVRARANTVDRPLLDLMRR